MAVPVLTSISPASGPTAGATVVTLVGTGLDTVSAVAFDAAPAADFAILSATQLVAVTPADTGTAAVTVTNPDGTSNALSFEFSDGLFTVAEARAFDKGQLADPSAYTDDAITDKEAEIREWLQRACGVEFVSTLHTDEVHSGDGTRDLWVSWPEVQSVTAAATRSDATWTALTADELADIIVRPDLTSVLYREGSCWPSGVGNVRVTYTSGMTSVPDLVKRAALRICVQELPASNVPFAAESYDDGGITVSFTRGDGFNGAWHRDPEVMKAIRMYARPVVA